MTFEAFMADRKAVPSDDLHEEAALAGLSPDEVEAGLFVMRAEGRLRHDGLCWVLVEPTGLTPDEEECAREHGFDPYEIGRRKHEGFSAYEAIDAKVQARKFAKQILGQWARRMRNP